MGRRMKRAVAPNTEQKRFHNFLAEHGCFECGAPAALHHAIGSTRKEIEKAVFSFYAEKYVATMDDIPGEVIQAIADYRR